MKSKTIWVAVLTLYILLALTLTGCTTPSAAARQPEGVVPSPQEASVEFTLKTGMADGRMVFIGVGGEIDGKTNPELHVQPGNTVHLVLVNDDGMQHDLELPDFDAHIPPFMGIGEIGEITFTVGKDQTGTYPYFCTVPGHRQAGMEGMLVVAGE